MGICYESEKQVLLKPLRQARRYLGQWQGKNETEPEFTESDTNTFQHCILTTSSMPGWRRDSSP